MLNKISIIYNTCDKYESLWDGFFILWDRYWPNCNNDIIMNTETKSYNFRSKLNIKSPIDNKLNCSWSQRLINSLEVVTTPYVLLVLDDFYLKSPVDLLKLEQCVSNMEKDHQIKLYTFGWQPGPNYATDDDSIFERRGRFAKYRVNAQIGLWRVSYLKKILKTYENPWQFELNGSFRSSIYGGKLYSIKKDAPLIFDYDWGFLIIRGKVNEKVAEYFRINEGLKMNLPFEKFNEEEYLPPDGSKIRRLIYYGVDMLLSLVRR